MNLRGKMAVNCLLLCLAPLLSAQEMAPGDFSASPIDDATKARMRQGGSYPEACTVEWDDLRYLRVLHYDYNGEVRVGEMVCNKSIAADLLDIFRELYRQKYPIARMTLIDDYNADDEASMLANNTSCFCYRKVLGSRKLSKHALGLAVDINPVENPCVRYTAEGSLRRIQPDCQEARDNIKRSPRKAHQITDGDLCHRLFRSHGFTWGGDWRRTKDYQHFEKSED